MILNWICLISIIALVVQVMLCFYMNALSDLKPRKTVVRRVVRTRYNSEINYKNKIAK